MSDEEFLKRWSRRKQEARKEDKAAEQAPPPAEAAATTPAAPPEPELDLSKLPPLDSITASTDITEFLRKGIPAELSRAALRRAWAADPAIRDFVGLAENAWDFTDPNAMPGFGALQGTPEQIRAMVESVIGGARDSAEKIARDLSEREHEPEKPAPDPGISAAEAPSDAAVVAMRQADESIEPVAATQPEASDEEGDVMPVQRRTHGGALPS
ncbi:DUF3306 domain-containing protein [Bradyrhizobium sp.]|uniref:DUF3306 domain-containing protein n=1 Tax=Bradyrhizobium sp. TaxID=376 RepID=UPI004037FB6D